ncbi:hypothetical protein CVT24_005292 [Panaeolus cyanescens]|uniref:Ribosomal protein L10 n=1 Tax=Panaeolus cyanescens TaxID=181874 RepID=A0A409Y8S2_9AGAR|nr:hypothetical protein CVT24_005292 [Panaeolus cyanescens]
MQSLNSSRRLILPPLVRSYAISVKTPKPLAGKKYPRVFKDKKAFQYNWYSRILRANTSSPVLIFHHNEFSAQRLKQLRADIFTANQKVKSAQAAANGPTPVSATDAQPTLTVVRTSIFGAALRDVPGVNLAEVEHMINNQSGSFAVLSLPSLNPPQLSAILRAMDKSVPPKAPKTPEEIKAEQDLKKADPAQPGRRMKRSRQIRIPELKLMGAIIENRVFLPQNVQDVSKLPTLQTLHAQIVGLLSAPASQLAAVLGEASGGRIARTLEGLKLSLQAANEPTATDDKKVES